MSGFGIPSDFQDAFKFHDLSPSTRKHLSKVYMLLSGLVGACAVGSYLSVAYHISNAGASLLGLLCVLYVFFTNEKSPFRLSALLLFGLLEGLSIGPLVEISLNIDPKLVLTALTATFGIFGSFTLAALYSDKRQHIYLGSLLSSGLSILFLFSLLRFIGFSFIPFFNINLYLGLFIFMGYIIYDTQLIILRCEQGEKDHYVHAIHLFFSQ